MGVDLQALARSVRKHPGVTAKAEIGLVSEVFQSTDWLAGPGDDGAVVTDQGVSLVVGGEASTRCLASRSSLAASCGSR